ncbi:YjzD family protein [Peribacillus alkalitolerans]|uniref:YjzD family protein n=1 Tax=Peribacillus alkalitolerans TaxID=1550385 RepID=UPI0013D55C7B|nr:YjzD family protein [Peribacillus alkalitolerans]
MRFVMTFFWTFLLVQMLTYVVSSMSGVHYSFTTGTTLAVVVFVLISVLSFLIPNEPVEHSHH